MSDKTCEKEICERKGNMIDVVDFEFDSCCILDVILKIQQQIVRRKKTYL